MERSGEETPASKPGKTRKEGSKRSGRKDGSHNDELIGEIMADVRKSGGDCNGDDAGFLGENQGEMRKKERKVNLLMKRR